jgi:hypothetical protein
MTCVASTFVARYARARARRGQSESVHGAAGAACPGAGDRPRAMRALIPDSVAIDCRILALLVRASRISHLRVRKGSADEDSRTNPVDFLS